MTTLDDVERTLRPRDGAGLRRRGPVGHRRRHGRPDLRGLRQDHPRADGGRDLGRAEHPARPRRRSAAHARPRPGSRSSCTPSRRIAAQRLAARLMVELCGARLVAGHDRRLPGAAGAAGGRAAAGRASSACWARRIREDEVERILRVARLRRRAREATALDGDRALLARRRRAARGRPDRGGRAHPRPRQAADHAARARASRRPADARASGCGAGWRTRCATAACTRWWPGASPRPTTLAAAAAGRRAGARRSPTR